MAGNLADKLRQGIDAARRGEKANAAKLLRQVVDKEPNNEVAWMWLASALDNLGERRNALEEALRINPGNTRAQEALKQITAVMPTVAERVGTTRRPGVLNRNANLSTGGGNTNSVVIIVVGVLIGLFVLVAIIFNVVNSSQQAAIPNESTQIALQNDLLFTDTPPPTIDPDTFTATPFFGIIVTPNNLPVLPATFTPTSPPTALPTASPTATSFPLSTFVMYFSGLTGAAQPALYRANGDGTGESEIGPADAGFADVALAPNGETLAFVRVTTYAADDGTEVIAPELFVAPVSNPGAARQVTRMGGSILNSPTWAPDSIQLVFVSNIDGDEELFYITEDGNNLTPLTVNDLMDRDPVWSPAGDVIAYASEQANAPGSGLTEIFTITPDGLTINQLTNDNNSSYSPAWSPDGTRLVFASDRNSDGDIFIMDADGQRQTRLTVDDGDAEDRHPAFTPAGQSVIFLSNRDGDTFTLYEVDLEGKTVTRLAGERDIQSFTFRPAVIR
ncbi:MAG: hypothetical protein K8L97_09055 [Anaerolineae bacterium]|nr:hypothetical protein [Anaerolineae bacterium]